MTSSVHLFSYFSRYSSVFVETGTYLGDGVERALRAGFKEVYSCEINQELVERARIRFNSKKVEVIHAPSQEALPLILRKIHSSAVFFLDGHAMPESESSSVFGTSSLVESAKDDPNIFSPLMVELGLISGHPLKSHIILIDDRQCFDTWMFDFLSESTVRDYIKTINPNYQFSYFENVLCCYPTNPWIPFQIWFDKLVKRIKVRLF